MTLPNRSGRRGGVLVLALSGAAAVVACVDGSSEDRAPTAMAGSAGALAGGAGVAGSSGSAGDQGATSGTAGVASTGGSSGTGAGGSGGGAGLSGGTSGAGGAGASGAGAGGVSGASGLGGAGLGGGGGSGVGGGSGAAGKGGASGASGKGGAGGQGGSGQAGATACNIGGQHNGDGSFTWYYFGQGTAPESGGFRTACGYFGTESGGQDSDRVENIANPQYFVAIPGPTPENFTSAEYCGACVELTGQNGQKVVATVVDECPQNYNQICDQNPGGALDVSRPAFNQLGFSVGDPRNTSWRFVPCPVMGNVQVRFKQGNNNEFFVENGVTAIKSVSVNGQMATRTSYGAWHVGGAISTPATLNLTDRADRSITVELNSGTQNQDTGMQFPKCL